MMHKQVVFWPHGTKWDPGKQAVVFADGSEALVGEVFTGGGGSYDTTIDFESLLESESAAVKIARCVRVTGAPYVLVAAP